MATTDAAKKPNVDSYFDREGVKLRLEQIVKNKGCRVIEKLKLNDFWGKIGQRTNFSKVKYVTRTEGKFPKGQIPDHC